MDFIILNNHAIKIDIYDGNDETFQHPNVSFEVNHGKNYFKITRGPCTIPTWNNFFLIHRFVEKKIDMYEIDGIFLHPIVYIA